MTGLGSETNLEIFLCYGCKKMVSSITLVGGQLLCHACFDAVYETPFEDLRKRRAPTLAERVREFHRAIGQQGRTIPEVPSDEEVRVRLRLITEEYFELLRACLVSNEIEPKDPQFDWPLDWLEARLYEDIDLLPVYVDLPEAVDALADLAYLVEGTHDVIGSDSKLAEDEVHRANMAKVVGGHRDANGKWRKPEGWRPPDIAGVLERQGWKR